MERGLWECLLRDRYVSVCVCTVSMNVWWANGEAGMAKGRWAGVWREDTLLNTQDLSVATSYKSNSIIGL